MPHKTDITEQRAKKDQDEPQVSLPASSPSDYPDLKTNDPIDFPQEVIRAEANFLILPFFSLWDKDVTRRTETEYTAIVSRDGQRLEISWSVSANPRFGYPGPFDRKVHRAIEQIISEMRTPLDNPIPIGSLYHIAKLLNLKDSGQVYRDIKSAIQRIVATTVESKGVFYSKGTQEWIEDQFHLYDRVIFRGRHLPSGQIADTNYIFLSSWYLDNINARYVRPLDYLYYRSLKGHIASRLYELLGIKFYGIGSYPYIRYRYSTLCQLLPITRYRYPSQARRKLQRAHEELERTGFFTNVEWADIPGEDRDWYVTYWPGPRAKEEIQRFRRQALLAETSSITADELGPGDDHSARPKRRTAKKKLNLTKAQQGLANQLEEIGVSRVTAAELVQEVDSQSIANWLKAIEEEESIQARPAYLVKALREGWQLPESFQLREIQLQEQTRQAQKQRKQRNCTICQGQGFYRLDTKTVVRCDHSERKGSAPKSQQHQPAVTDSVWEQVLEKLQAQTSQAVYESWLKDTRFIGTDGESVFISAASELAREWLERRLYGLIARALEEALGREVVVEFVPE